MIWSLLSKLINQTGHLNWRQYWSIWMNIQILRWNIQTEYLVEASRGCWIRLEEGGCCSLGVEYPDIQMKIEMKYPFKISGWNFRRMSEEEEVGVGEGGGGCCSLGQPPPAPVKPSVGRAASWLADGFPPTGGNQRLTHVPTKRIPQNCLQAVREPAVKIFLEKNQACLGKISGLAK